MGDPAMGPVAYPHRASASENPMAPLSHHLQDSTHVADDVITVGLAHRNFRLEASGFHGREPDEYRWNIDSGAMDSWSTRVTVNPAANWSLQYSIAQLHSPESLAPNDDVRRMTASVAYNRPHPPRKLGVAFCLGTKSVAAGRQCRQWIPAGIDAEFFKRNYVWTRIENADRTNELLLGDNPRPPGFAERYFARVQAYTAGYDREVGHIPHLSTALGGQTDLVWRARRLKAGLRKRIR